jgi:RNA polymerase sigma factor (sigma-70 family)
MRPRFLKDFSCGRDYGPHGIRDREGRFGGFSAESGCCMKELVVPSGMAMTSEFAVPAVSPAVQRVLRQYAPMCQRMAAGHEANPEAARDLAQDILVAVWRAWPAYRGLCSERTYVARIAQYRIATHIGRAVREPSRSPLTDDLVAQGPTPEDSVIRGDAYAYLAKEVRALPTSLREVAILMLEGFTQPEIAETLGITVNAVAIRASRARDQLRAGLEKAHE